MATEIVKPPGAIVPAGSAVAAFIAVAVVGGLAYPANPFDAGHAGFVRGLSLVPAAMGADCCFQLMGPVSNPGWSFQPGAALFLGVGGALAPSLPAGAKFVQRLGVADGATSFWLAPELAILTP